MNHELFFASEVYSFIGNYQLNEHNSHVVMALRHRRPRCEITVWNTAMGSSISIVHDAWKECEPIHLLHYRIHVSYTCRSMTIDRTEVLHRIGTHRYLAPHLSGPAAVFVTDIQCTSEYRRQPDRHTSRSYGRGPILLRQVADGIVGVGAVRLRFVQIVRVRRPWKQFRCIHPHIGTRGSDWAQLEAVERSRKTIAELPMPWPGAHERVK